MLGQETEERFPLTAWNKKGIITTHSELHRVVFVGAVCDFFCLCMYEISRETLNGLATNSRGRRVWSLARTSLKVKVNFGGLRVLFEKNLCSSSFFQCKRRRGSPKLPSIPMEEHEGTPRSYVRRDLILIWGNISSQTVSSTYGTLLTTELLHLLLWTASTRTHQEMR